MPKASPRILIINVHSALNAGDLALLEGAVRILRGAFDHPRITVSANWPDESALGALGLEVVPSPWHAAGVGAGGRPRWQVHAFLVGILWALWLRAGLPLSWVPVGWRTTLEVFGRVDLVAAVPGNQFFSSGRFGWPLPLIAFPAWLAHLFGLPLYVLPQSIGPFVRGRDRWLLRMAYGRARRVYLRDLVSLRLAGALGLPAGRVRFLPDPAFDYPPAPADEALAVLCRHGFQPGQPALGVTVLAQMPSYLNQAGMQACYQALAAALPRLAREHGAQVMIFVQVTGPAAQEDDRAGVREVLARIGPLPAGLHYVDEVLPPALLKACYGQMEAFLASRLHSGIFAMGMQVPSLCIGYLTKTRGVLEAAGLEDNLLELQGLDEARLWEKLEQLWLTRQAGAERLRQVLPGLVAQLGELETEIAGDYAGYQP